MPSFLPSLQFHFALILIPDVTGAYFYGHIYIRIVGELLTTEEARRRQRLYDELASAGKLSPALIVIREHLPSGKACLRVNIDATKVGDVARFINHSCDGSNLQPVLVWTSGSLLPRLCFFSARDIEEGEELTFWYGSRPKWFALFFVEAWVVVVCFLRKKLKSLSYHAASVMPLKRV